MQSDERNALNNMSTEQLIASLKRRLDGDKGDSERTQKFRRRLVGVQCLYRDLRADLEALKDDLEES